ncbi:MAG: PDZ domain-containing protein [Candidatus Stygibacter frigidus]|nr:PDZ domain-containing protein [Candidatus Stygibacter frigidus]
MMRKIIILIIFLEMFTFMQADFSDQAITKIFADELLSVEDIYQQLIMFNDFQEVPDKEKVIQDSLADGSPWFYYIPKGYDPQQSQGMIIWLHGGVGREDYFESDDYWIDHPIIEYANEASLLVLMPMGRSDCMWWDSAGEKHIFDELLIMKERFNIDDDKVYMTGFSDGGSGSFHFGYRMPNEFAAFYPLNGMISVPAHVTGKPCFIRNLQNRHLRAVNTDEDMLYPAASTRLTMDLALSAGADISYQEYWGMGHDWGYFDEDLPLLMKDIQKRVRDSFHSEIYWECLNADEYKRCDWVEITELDTLAEKQDWQQEYNVQLPDDRISFGFYNDAEFKGDGILVNRVIEPSVASEMGLHDGDIIIAMDEVTITNIDEMEELKAEKQRGDEVSLTVYREGETSMLKGAFPEITYYNALFYDQPSGAVKAKYYGNIFDVQTSRVGALAIYINPDMVNLKISVKVVINNNEVFNEIIDYDSQIMEDNIIKYKERKALWVNKLDFNVEK